VIVCEGFGIPAPNISWFSNNSRDEEFSGSGAGLGANSLFLLSNISEEIEIATSSRINADGYTISISTLRIIFAMKSDENTSYTCLANNGVSDATINVTNMITITLTVQVKPEVSVFGSAKALGVVGNSISLSFNITEDSPQVTSNDIRWTFTNNLMMTTDITGAISNGYSFSADLRTLTIIGINNGHEGNYTLTATNAAGSGQDVIRLEVEGACGYIAMLFECIVFAAGPVILQAPLNQEVIFGTDVQLNCTSSSEPLHSVTWIFNNTIEIASYNTTLGSVFTSSSTKYTLDDPSSDSYGLLTISNVTLSDAGIYTCTVSNIHETASAAAVLQIQLPPTVNISDLSIQRHFGGNVTFSCFIEAFPQPMITWSINDTTIQNANTQISSTSDGVTSSVSTITIVGLKFDNNGEYICQAENELAEKRKAVSQPLVLEVLCEHSI
jgi:hemicentin